MKLGIMNNRYERISNNTNTNSSTSILCSTNNNINNEMRKLIWDLYYKNEISIEIAHQLLDQHEK